MIFSLRRAHRIGFPRLGLLLCLLGILFGAQLAAQPHRPRGQAGKEEIPTQAEAEVLLRLAREQVAAEPWYVEFGLRIIPRRGEEQIFPGRLWKSRDAAGPITKIVFPDDSAIHGELAFVGRGEAQPQAWKAVGKNGAETPISILEPLVGSDLTLFDLHMPFLFWPEPRPEGRRQVGSRSTDVLILLPPEKMVHKLKGISAVRVYLDSTYHVVLKSEQLDENFRPTKTFQVTGLKREGDRYTVKTLELRDEATRRKTRFDVRLLRNEAADWE